MAEGALEKPLSLAEQYSIQGIEKTGQIEVSAKETTRNNSPPPDASFEEITAEKTAETCVSEVVAEKIDQIVEQEGSSVEEVSIDAPEEQVTKTPDVEEKPEIKIETAPADFRFPTTNQTRHCFTRYVEYHRCVAAKGEDAFECNKFAKYYRSLCPGEWVDRWNEQRANGTFPGPL